jgi:hypothetical protein
MKLLFAISLSYIITSLSFADTLSVPSQYSTIQSAVNAASTGDTVEVAAGTYYETLTVNKAINLIGLGGASNTIIDGNGGCNVITIENLQIWPSLEFDGFTITGGAANYNNGTWCPMGGGFHIYNSLVTIRNCIISGNESAQHGGGLYIRGWHEDTSTYTSVNIYDSIITDNHAGYDGGGVYTINHGAQYTDTFCNLRNTPVYGNSAGTTNESHEIFSHRSYIGYDGGDFWITDATGACCLDQGGCITSTSGDCTKAGGSYQGDDTLCDSTCEPIPPTTGACCLEPSGCIITTANDCGLLNGDFHSNSYSCEDFECGTMPDSGGCCTNGNCYDLAENICDQINGDFQGDNVPCQGQGSIENLEVTDYCCGGYWYKLTEDSIEFGSTDGYGYHYATITIPEGQATLNVFFATTYNKNPRFRVFDGNWEILDSLYQSGTITLEPGTYVYEAVEFGGSISWSGGSDPIECTLSDCAADLNGDGEVDIDDLLLLIGAWGVCP